MFAERSRQLTDADLSDISSLAAIQTIKERERGAVASKCHLKASTKHDVFDARLAHIKNALVAPVPIVQSALG